MSIIKKILATIIGSALAIIFPFVTLTLITSKTPALLGIQSFVVLSGSMEPVFPVGSIVYAQKLQNYNLGDVVTFKTTGDKNITHRIYSIEKKNNQSYYITKGDSNNSPDNAPVISSQITGKVFFFVPYLGKLVNLLKSPTYFFGLIIFPSILFIGFELWNIKKEIVRSTEKRILEKIQNQISTGGNYEIDFK